MTTSPVQRWRDLPRHRRASGINIAWIGHDDRHWDIGGYNEGAQGAVITGPVRGMVHRPWRGVWHEPAYGAPRFERTVDERREVSFPITLMHDSEFGWFNTESNWWDGMSGDEIGWLCAFTRHKGNFYIPMQLAEVVEDELEEDPTNNGNYSQTWMIKLAADGEPRWRTPDVKPEVWTVRNTDPIVQMKAGDGLLSPMVNCRAHSFKVANRGTKAEWPIYMVSAPGRVWLPDGVSGRMLRVPRLYAGEHVLIDTNPEHRIAISAKDPSPSWLDNVLSNVDLLEWLGITEFEDRTETVLERFHGQGFTKPIEPGTVATLPVFHSQVGARVSVRLPQRHERAVS